MILLVGFITLTVSSPQGANPDPAPDDIYVNLSYDDHGYTDKPLDKPSATEKDHILFTFIL
jgi:hypothetical protein